MLMWGPPCLYLHLTADRYGFCIAITYFDQNYMNCVYIKTLTPLSVYGFYKYCPSAKTDVIHNVNKFTFN